MPRYFNARATLMQWPIPQSSGHPLVVELEVGRQIFVVGPNGSGKSALLQYFAASSSELAKGKTDTGRAWVYVRDDRPFGGRDRPADLFRYSRNRSGDYPAEHLRGNAGILQADAFAGYNRFYEDIPAIQDATSFRDDGPWGTALSGMSRLRSRPSRALCRALWTPGSSSVMAAGARERRAALFATRRAGAGSTAFGPAVVRGRRGYKLKHDV